MIFRAGAKLQSLRIPISLKLVWATLSLLLVTVGLLVYQSTQFFQKVSEDKELELNQSSAETKAVEIDNVLQSLLEKAKTIALLSSRDDDASMQSTVQLLLEQDHDLLAIDAYSRNSGGFALHSTFMKPGKLEQIGGKDEDIAAARAATKFSFEAIAQGQIEIRKIASNSNLPIIGLAFPLARDELGRTNAVAVAYTSITKLQKIFSQHGKREIFLVDKRGRLLSHPREDLVLKDEDFSQHPLFLLALKDQNPRGQMNYMPKGSKREMTAAYARTMLGPIVISQLPEDEILEPARLVRRKAIIITGFIVSASVLFIFLLSLSLVNPIERLAGLIREVSKGNFEISARKQIKSRDEVGDLARAFDDMIVGLKERDKVKTLFSKFHGSSVTQDLLGKEIGVGGARKNVTVFFSDVRGFTSFSESRSPEEVVEMLNEYFGTMVAIINRNGGVVDKFIGDAIMAVWGAPNEGPNDTAHALMACLEMRVALGELNARRIARGDEPIVIGMGLHTGQAISGTIGSEERMEYTVIGDTVNLTSRIEASTKSFGTDLLISDAVLQVVGETFWTEKAGDVIAKGKSEPIALFKVRGTIIDGEQRAIKTEYSDYEAEHSEKIQVA